MNNTGSASISGWSVKWAFANGQTVSQSWNGIPSSLAAR
ncbi:cellulose binding domain-containing protein [Microbispora rosea]